MALSDYERRVLDEIETELRVTAARRWRLSRVLLVVGTCVVLAAGLTAVAIIVLPAGISAVVACVAGALAGYGLALAWWRHRDRGPL